MNPKTWTRSVRQLLVQRYCQELEIVPSQVIFIALNLMTVQPQADQPLAETGADLVGH